MGGECRQLRQVGLGWSALGGQAKARPTALSRPGIHGWGWDEEVGVRGRGEISSAHFGLRVWFFSHSTIYTKHLFVYVSYETGDCKAGPVPECA